MIPRGGRREAAKAFFKRKRKAGEIERLKSRLKEYQDTLDTSVLVDIRQTINKMCSQQDSQYSNLNQQLSGIAASLASCRISTADILRTDIRSVTEANKKEHEITRTHIDSTVQALTSDQVQLKEIEERHHRFLKSLRFDDMNLRSNEISESHRETFGWIFNDETGHAWDDFNHWLRKGQKIYWINGKAGSGKSTLMKFIVEDERTLLALNSWANGKDCMILKFYFWLSGSKFQRAMKGFLCSLLHQMMSNDGNLIESVIFANRSFAQKRMVGDWSPNELKDVLQLTFKQVEQSSKICVFLDGLDEFDQADDLYHLLDLVEEHTHLENVKFCVSSRPDINIEKRLSRYKKLRLQDLTAKDMQLYITDSLQLAYERYPSNSIGAEDIDEFTNTMTDKADGVFLWVHLAMNSLLRGLRNEDDFGVLLQRLEGLPSGMEQLYQQMWQRLNGDEQLYRQEASTYFSYHEFFPLSFFEFMVALNGDILTRYLQDMRPQNPTELAQKCRSLENLVHTRCAGLLEVVTQENDSSDYESSRISSDDGASIRSPSEGTEEPQQVTVEMDHEIESESDFSQLSASDKPSLARDSYIDSKESTALELQVYHGARIKFLHRTARDFLLGTKAGHDIAGETSQTRDERFANRIRARMATLLQDLEVFYRENITSIIEEVGSFSTEYEIELLTKLRRVCETLSIPGSKFRDINRFDFWNDGFGSVDFLGRTAQYECVEYVKHCLDHEIEYASSYYRGYLFMCAVDDVYYLLSSPKRLELASWLSQNGADLGTKHRWVSRIQIPFQYLLEEILYHCLGEIAENDDVPALSQMAELIQAHFPTAFKSTDKYIVRITERASLGLTEVQLSTIISIELGASCCCRLALYCLARLGVEIGTTTPAPSRSAIPLRITLLAQTGGGDSMRPNLEDSIRLGKAYEKVLFQEDYAEGPVKSRDDFISCLEEVFPRCESVRWQQGHRDIGYSMDLPPNAMVLDPSEDVNETNWQEKGWFRTPDPITKGKESSASSSSESNKEGKAGSIEGEASSNSPQHLYHNVRCEAAGSESIED